MDWFRGTRPTEVYLSVLVIGEIRQGSERLRPPDPRRSERHEEWLRALQESFSERVLAVTTPVAEAWGLLRAT